MSTEERRMSYENITSVVDNRCPNCNHTISVGIHLHKFSFKFSYNFSIFVSSSNGSFDCSFDFCHYISNTHIHSSNQMLLTLINNIYGTVSAIGARQLNQAPPDQSMNSVQNVQDIPGNRLDNQNDNEPVDE